MPTKPVQSCQSVDRMSSNRTDLQQHREQPCWLKGSVGLLIKCHACIRMVALTEAQRSDEVMAIARRQGQ